MVMHRRVGTDYVPTLPGYALLAANVAGTPDFATLHPGHSAAPTPSMGARVIFSFLRSCVGTHGDAPPRGHRLRAHPTGLRFARSERSRHPGFRYAASGLR